MLACVCLRVCVRISSLGDATFPPTADIAASYSTGYGLPSA